MTADTDRHKYFLSCDWGTTSFRLNLVDMKTCNSIGGIEDTDGIKKMDKLRIKTAPISERKEFLLQSLNKKIIKIQKKSGQSLKNIPIVISGMASSNMGIREVSYLPLPFLLEIPKLHTELIKKNNKFQHDLILISGVCSQNDVMRGEETQLFGLVEKYNLSDGLCIFPGTHSKHLFLKEGKLVSFKTFMTGELFDLINSASILRNSILKPNVNHSQISESFCLGVQKAMDENILNSIFTIRANDILYKTSRHSNYNFLSGLLIGTELKSLLENPPEMILISGDRILRTYYSSALDYLNLPYTVDQNSNDLIFSVHKAILKQSNY